MEYIKLVCSRSLIVNFTSINNRTDDWLNMIPR